MIAAIILVSYFGSLGVPPVPDTLTPREKAVLACYREEPWVDEGQKWLKECLAKTRQWQ